MNDDTSGNTSKTEPITVWKRLRTMTDEQVHAAITADPDITPTDEAFWKDARVVIPRLKENRDDGSRRRPAGLVSRRTRLSNEN